MLLLAEDTDAIRELFAEALTRHGFEVETARDGREAWLKAQALHPDLIVTDLRMPGMDGLEMTRRLKEDAGTSSIPVVMCTSEPAESHARAAGCAAFLQKPCSADALVAVVASYVPPDAA